MGGVPVMDSAENDEAAQRAKRIQQLQADLAAEQEREGPLAVSSRVAVPLPVARRSSHPSPPTSRTSAQSSRMWSG